VFRKSAARLALAAVSAGVMALGGPSAASAATCANADVIPTAAAAAEVRDSVLCLVNAERAQRGLAAFKAQTQLAKSADGHAKDMVRRGYFSHTSKDGRELADRVRAAGYLKGRWSIGENLAWGTGVLATPANIVKAWLDSPGHKAIMLSPNFRDAGIGLAIGSPKSAAAGATVALNVGKRTTATAAKRR
jgi:uncharacterized protein YkwD